MQNFEKRLAGEVLAAWVQRTFEMKARAARPWRFRFSTSRTTSAQR